MTALEKNIADYLTTGLHNLNLDLIQQQQEKILQYIKLLEKWNKSYNLTAVRKPLDMLDKHILDSLLLQPYLKEVIESTEYKITSILDVGSGAGLPGIPLAIAFPEIKITLLDSNGKKTAFLQQVKTELKLENIYIINNRVENLKGQFYDLILSRAFSSLKKYLKLTKNSQNANTLVWAMKGKYPEEELREIPKDYTVSASHMLQTPNVDGERHLLQIQNKQIETQ